MTTAAVIGLLYILISITCVAVSGWSTYYGFLVLLQELTLPVTGVIVAGLFICDLAILKARQQGQSILGATFVLLLFVAASAASNFNYFYTNFMRQDVVAGRLQEAARTFDENMRLAENAIRAKATLPAAIASIRDDLRRLSDEVRDPSAKGFGPRARPLVTQIVGKTQIQEPALPPAGAPPEVNEKVLATITERVNAKIAAMSEGDPLMRVLGSIEQKKAQQQQRLKIAALAQDSIDAGVWARIAAIDAWENDTLLVEREVRQALTLAGSPATITLKKPTSSTGTGLGSIPDSIRSGFFEMPNPFATVLAASAAVMIDIIPLLVALFLVSNKGQSTAGAKGGRRSIAGGAYKIPVLGED